MRTAADAEAVVPALTPARPAMGSEVRRPLLPAPMARPEHLLWVGALPQALLLFLNWRAWTLAVGEMSTDQRASALMFGVYGLGLCVMCVALPLGMRLWGRTHLALRWCWPLLLLPVGYLALAFTGIEGVVPATVADWILPRGELFYNQFLLTMPLVFYAGLRLACFEVRVSTGVDFTVSALAVLLVAVLSYLLLHIGVWGGFGAAYEWYFLSWFLVIATLLVLGAFLRTMTIGYVAARGTEPAIRSGLACAVALVAPLVGLALNATIPFPSDLQSPVIYALAITNGVLLLLPSFRHPWLGRAVWLAQCALFPFILYFFLVFLPLLPLSLLAMIVAGAGFLILTPVALFFVHAERLVDGYRCEVRDGSRRRTALLGLGAALLLPVGMLGNAWLDRVTLRGAIDYVYSPELRQPVGDHFRGSPWLVGRSLERLRDFKAGLWMPFLSDAYNRVVFGGLVLPDGKMSHLHRVFLGRDLPAVNERRADNFFGSPNARSRRSSVREVNGPPRFAGPAPTSPVVLENLERQTTAEGACERTRLVFTMHHTGKEPAGEFAMRLKLPEAVRVSGFWLFVGPERVPGRLVEKKTAQWVYHRIRDAVVKRDPGILFYADPETLELRVFPFAAGELRTVEIELLYPTALTPTIQVGERTLALGDAAAGATTVTNTGGEGVSVTLANDADVPRFRRTPYLHFLIDRSADADLDEHLGTRGLRAAMELAAQQIPEARDCVVTAGNYDCDDLFPDPVPLASFANGQPNAAELARRLPTARGGWREGRALRRGLLSARARLRRGDDAALGRYPVFVVLRSSHSHPLSEGDGANDAGTLAALARSASPDVPFYLVSDGPGGTPRAVSFAEGGIPPVPEGRSPMELARPVGLVRVGNEVGVTVADGTTNLRFGPVATVGESGSALRPEAFDPVTRRFRPMDGQVVIIPKETPYAQSTAAALRNRDYVENPSGGNVVLAEIAALSRRANTLVGATSFIVVENSAQWEILRRKEAQKLANAPALEVEEVVPEPATWALLLLGGGLLMFTVNRRRRRSSLAAGTVGMNDSRFP